ncbi:LOW QUALITY PROTEIN: TRAF-interacting protein with FHA domain-containing protein B [Tamandua tetradactyla]|uniref:LOW QUALITY PROTEIN: TRAF-interacting protein with FHA domain-containing protein B n=1 Tax=Tamandua tetradactyla TaxID=48850 RepID=UPI0040545AEA
MERPLTVLRVSLHHAGGALAAFASVPPRRQHDVSPLLVGRGRDAHLRLRLPSVSRRHLSLEPYREDGGTLLAFCLKVLSRRGCVWVNGLTLRYLEQVPLSPVSRVAFSGVQMVVRIEGGGSLEALVCCFQLSSSPLIYRPEAEESDECEGIPQEPAGPDQGRGLQVTWGFLKALPRRGTALSSQALEEKQKYYSRGSPKAVRWASLASGNTPLPKQDEIFELRPARLTYEPCRLPP